MERFHLYRPPGAGGAFMAASDDGPWVRLADAQSTIDAANQRAERAERERDEWKRDAENAGKERWNETQRATDAERRLALAVAEVKAWRAVTLQPGWTGTLPVGAMVATDADPVLAKMIGGGE
jgi:hypothetical protein